MIPEIIGEFISTANISVRQLALRITDVRYDPVTPNGIEFLLDGELWAGVLAARNRSLVLGCSAIQDKAIAVRVLLDGHAEPVSYA